MFCDKCGASSAEGTKFCEKCGNQLAQAGAVPQQTVAQPAGEQKKEKGFFSSPAGIILVVILGIAVIGGLTLGAVFLFKDNSHNEVDAATMEVWDEYEDIATEDSEKVAKIDMNPDNLAQLKADLENSQKKVAALQDVAEKTTGARATAAKKPPPEGSTADTKSDEMEEILETYKVYTEMINKFLGTLVGAITGNQLSNPDVVADLNKILAELEKLAKAVKAAGEKFLDPETVTILVDRAEDLFPNEPPPEPEELLKTGAIFTVAKTITPQVEKSVSEAQAAEAARIEAEKAAAEAAAAAASQAASSQQSDSGGQRITCPECGGLGYFVFPDGSTKPCPNCEGKGWYISP